MKPHDSTTPRDLTLKLRRIKLALDLCLNMLDNGMNLGSMRSVIVVDEAGMFIGNTDSRQKR